MKKVKYYYMFKPDLGSHIQFYAGWVSTARKHGLPIKMISFVSFKNYLNNYNIAKKIRKENNALIIPVPSIMRSLITVLFFSMTSLDCDEVIIHLKKVSPNIFNKLKHFNKKIRYAIDLEGDPVAERDYLMKYPYKKGFYDQIINNLEQQIQKYDELLVNSDYIFTVTERLRDIIIERYPFANNKVGVLPTGVDHNKFYFDEIIRKHKREQMDIDDKFVIIFTGNVYYSWQNLKRTLEVFKIIKKIKNNAFLILLIRKSDLSIAEEFIHEAGMEEMDYFLANVSNEEVNEFLNASDMGILLRHNHIMNQVSSPGKIGEYALTGLPILATQASSSFSEQLYEKGQMIILQDIDNNAELVDKISRYNFMGVNRTDFQNYCIDLFSNQSYIESYIESLKNI